MKQVTSLLLAFLFLFGHAGFSVNVHFCGNKIVKSRIAIGDPNLDCGMASSDSFCENHQKNSGSLTHTSCCKNLHTVYYLNDETRTQFHYFSFSKEILSVIPVVLQGENVTLKNLYNKFFEASPPLFPVSLYIFYLSLLN